MSRFWMFILIFGLIAALWFTEATRVLTTLLFWSPFIAVPIVLAITYYGTPANKRQRFLAALQKHWLLWYPPFMLALVTTTAVAVASFAGMSVPYFGWGLRGTPWGYTYALHFIAWSVVTTIIAMHQKWIRVEVATFAGNWVRRGGFWKIWSRDNLPANSFLALYGFVVVMTALYGVPSPDVDAEMVKYESQMVTARAVNSDFVQTTQAKINDLVGHEVFALAVNGPLLRPEPRFVRGWGWVRLTFILTPFAFFGLLFSRRDEASALLIGFGSWVARRREKLSGEGGTSDTKKKESEGPEAESPKTKEEKVEEVKAKEDHEGPTVIKFPGLLSRLNNEIISEIVGRWIYDHLGDFAQWLGTKLARA